MSINKATFFINDGSYGWSESYYDKATSPALGDTMTRALALAKPRSQMLGSASACALGCSAPILQWIRVSQLGAARRTLFATIGTFNVPNPQTLVAVASTNVSIKNLPANETAADNPYSALEMALELSGGGTSKRAISGVPDDVICDQGFTQNSPFFSSAKTFIQQLIQSWGALQRLTPSSPPAGSVIDTITQDPNGRPIITLAAALPIACCATMQLQIFCYKATPGSPVINGIYRAFPVYTPPAVTTAVWMLNKAFPPLFPLCNGYAIQPAPSVASFNSGRFIRPMKKSRGRPTNLVRGRRRVALRG